MKVRGGSGLILLCARELSGFLKVAPLRWNLLQSQTVQNLRKLSQKGNKEGGWLDALAN